MKKLLGIILVLSLLFTNISMALAKEKERFENKIDGKVLEIPLEKRKVTNLADDIDYFNKTSLGKDKDKNDNYEFIKSGELWYDFPLAMRNGIEKIKIGRTKDNRPLVYIGVWRDVDSKELIINLCKDIMKYYAREDSDGGKIFTYVDESISNNKKPDKNKVLQFGNTTVGFEENDNTKSADLIIKLSGLLNDTSIDEVETTINGVTVIDISNAKVNHYDQVNGKIRIDKVGSTNNSMLGTRPNESSYEDDIKAFNKALNGSTWKLSNNGYLQWESMKYDDPDSGLIVTRNSEDQPVVKLRNWDLDGDAQALMPCPQGMAMNGFMESMKYYSESPSDGEAIYWYVEKAIKDGREVATGETYLFGKTKVKITDPRIFGIDVIFVDNSNEVKNKPQEVVDGDIVVIDISNAKVNHYEDREGGIRLDLVGSVYNSMMGTRPSHSTYNDDIALFNKALKGTTWKLSNNGYLQWESMKYDDPDSGLIVTRNSEGQPVVKIRNWDLDGDASALMPCPEGMTMNGFMESCKFYSKSLSDGEAIYWYVDKAVKEKKNIASNKVLQFGKTKVKISDPGVFGIDVIFVDNSNEVKNKPQEEVIDDDENIIKVDITNAEVPHYEDRLGRIRIDKVGSVNNSMVGTRLDGSSYEDDINTFNKALETSTWKLSSNGYLQWQSQKYDDPNAGLIIDRTDGKPRVKIKTWAINPGDEQLIPITMTLNVSMEAFKFYSNGNSSDGEAIWWFLDKHMRSGTDPEYGKVYQFGTTKVMFESESDGGNVVFLD